MCKKQKKTDRNALIMSEKEGRNICEQRYSDIDRQAGRHDTKQAIKKTDRL